MPVLSLQFISIKISKILISTRRVLNLKSKKPDKQHVKETKQMQSGFYFQQWFIDRLFLLFFSLFYAVDYVKMITRDDHRWSRFLFFINILEDIVDFK